MRITFVSLSMLTLPLALGACKDDDEPDPPTLQPELAAGEACDPTVGVIPPEDRQGVKAEDLPAVCAPGLACEPLVAGEGFVCGAAVEIRGRVFDSLSGEPIGGALVAALDETNAPVTDVVGTDACGDYVLPVSVRRDASGELAEQIKWTLNVTASDYQPFPGGPRPAIPVDTADVMPAPEGMEMRAETEGETGGPTFTKSVIENASTRIALIPLAVEDQGGATISGTVVGEDTAGTLVVAEGAEVPAPYAVADASGAYTLFNVKPGEHRIAGYRAGIEVEPASIMVSGQPLEAVDLPVVAAGEGMLGRVDGSLNIVDAAGGLLTSVVLVPASVFNEVLERGPVPFGLRSPLPPAAPDVSGAFGIGGVGAGTYKVLVAFENDELVRDPDEGIAGTAIQEITIAPGQPIVVDTAFKVTEALAVVSPGRDEPEQVEGAPLLLWADDSSEDRYELVVFDALGNKTFEDLAVPGVSGSDTVEVMYGGPALIPGMYYQFRVTSFRDQAQGPLAISRTEDLRGVFVSGQAEPPAECMLEAGTGTGG